MDHFNATVQNGHLVHTRRGLQVSKQKFNGLSFVNSYPQTFNTGSSSRKAKSGEPAPQREFKFVSKGQEPKPEGSRRQRKDVDEAEAAPQPDSVQGGKKRRERPRDQMSTASSASDCSSRPSSEASSPVMSEGIRTPTFLNERPFDDVRSPGLGPPPVLGQPQWSTPDLPTYMSAENRKLFHHYFAYVPRNIYPYEDILTYNPIKSSDFYYMVIKDLAALHCVLMTGSISEMLLDQQSSDSKGFAYHISKVCAILNRKLGQNKGVDPVTVECILALALMGSCVGRLDHWYMHMRGLQKVIEMNGGVNGFGPALISKIHKTDLKGAVALAATPYIPFVRSFSPISTVVPLPTRNQTTSTLTELLSSLHISPVTITSLTDLSIFALAVQLARSTSPSAASPGSSAGLPPASPMIPIAFDPHAFTDELHAVTYDLLVQPTPIRDPSTTGHGPANPFNPPDDSSSIPSAAATAVDELRANENYITNHRLHASGGPIVPSPLGEGGHLEPALRIAGLLFLKELLPDWPRNVGGYAVLLDLFGTHLRGLVDAAAGGRGTGARTAADRPRQAIHDAELANLDPALFEAPHSATSGSGSNSSSNGRRSGRDKGHNRSSLRIRELRPAVLWLCAFGNLVSLIADKNESRTSEGESYDRSIFRECLQDVAKVENPADIDCLSDEDMLFFRLFDLRGIQGEAWDDKAALQALLVGRII